MKNIKMVVFDMAGTTVDEDNIVYKTVQKVINNEGFSVSLDEVLQHGAGKEKHKAITDVLTESTDATEVSKIADKAFGAFKSALEKAYDESEIKTFDGLETFFETLKSKGIIVVLNTGYDRKTATKLVQKLNWQEGVQFDALITADDVEKGRPHPDMIFKAMTQFNITDSSEVLKAGDSEIDILEGKNAGCGITVGVLSGAQNKQQLQTAQPDYILDNLTDLQHILWK
ncbi:phosphonatase-like hydrolase [Niabella ginsengisoli]|uniref:Phosphonatase-like hydrolase n=1 Tax=Niabella ginsengisoli TaxID=522298 RepID=A0ABS9SIJ4_9BACT|nr:phosphonatase-like hydrolase [Niabella ginsengisoli]MCH5598186.1 phosphonatase-like hydrolase [Niabella ginsengisoli]